MDKKVWSELADVWGELSHGISLVSIIADGISTFTQCSAMSGKSAEAYWVAMQLAYDLLTAASKNFEKILDEANSEKKESAA